MRIRRLALPAILLALALLPARGAAQGEIHVSAVVLPPQGVEFGAADGAAEAPRELRDGTRVPVANRGWGALLVQESTQGAGPAPATRVRGGERVWMRLPPPRDGAERGATVTFVLWPMT